MSVFKTARQVSAEDAARRLGLQERHKRFLCPFHDDHDPSMACYANTGLFYCFSCHAKGDATTLWAKVKDMSMLEAARDLCAAYNLTPEEDARVKWLPPRQREESRREEALRKKRIDEVAMLPQAVWEDWQKCTLAVLEESIEANTRLLQAYPDPEGWMWGYAIGRIAALTDEQNRVKAIEPVMLAEEVAERRQQPHQPVDQPLVDERLLQRILDDRLRLSGMRLNAEEAAWVRRTLGIGG